MALNSSSNPASVATTTTSTPRESSSSSVRSSSSIARMKAILHQSAKKPCQTKTQTSSKNVPTIMEARASYFATR
ncbi:hypothetical protein BDBG_17287 [Blastomyces gilchristii SLH14081]|uniref:Uncharacterized protein n=2 Tax=Blastomyces TaxID=229219 RepID=A0A179UPJ3_BLAGS|nr:uncharacterized protein BDBG_17287 [Blastomyces gilchristii SLH14081]EGE77896.2 hypothetical protein BDDG_00833 [Blastomyces dermatitidis ATCC 18188]EQL38189.1 hypothetical protein BDFG_00566 [Blastomyces dermatitidis ATCC 26199]OAT09924.1 hypothetical protein BDBG_17287 [Blastomyces gilchristii SLH14081]